MIGSSPRIAQPQMAGGPLLAQLLAKLGGQPGTGPTMPAPAVAPAPMGQEASPLAPQLAPPIEIAAPEMPTQIEAAAPRMQGRGIFDRVGDYLRQPGVAAALFRSGAATMNGGLGAGLEAAAGYMDKRKGDEAKAAQQLFENAVTSGRLSLEALTQQQKNDLAKAGIRLDYDRLDETTRHNKTGEKIDLRGQDMQKYGIDTNAAVTTRGQDVSVANNNTDNTTAQRGQDLSYGANIYGTNAQIATAGIGSKAAQGYTETETVNPGSAGGWFSSASPASKTTTRVPIAPMAAPLTAPPAAPILAPSTAPLAPPKPGQVVGGKTFLGGDPRNPKSWR